MTSLILVEQMFLANSGFEGANPDPAGDLQSGIFILTIIGH